MGAQPARMAAKRIAGLPADRAARAPRPCRRGCRRARNRPGKGAGGRIPHRRTRFRVARRPRRGPRRASSRWRRTSPTAWSHPRSGSCYSACRAFAPSRRSTRSTAWSATVRSATKPSAPGPRGPTMSPVSCRRGSLRPAAHGRRGSASAGPARSARGAPCLTMPTGTARRMPAGRRPLWRARWASPLPGPGSYGGRMVRGRLDGAGTPPGDDRRIFAAHCASLSRHAPCMPACLPRCGPTG